MERDAAALDPLMRERPPKVLDASELPSLMPPPLERLLLRADVNVLLPMDADAALRLAPERGLPAEMGSAASSPALAGVDGLVPSSLPSPSPLRLLLPDALALWSPLPLPPFPPPTERPKDLLASELTPCMRESPENVAFPLPPRLRVLDEKLFVAAKLLVRLASGILGLAGASTPAPPLSRLPARGDAAVASSSTDPAVESLTWRDMPSPPMLLDASSACDFPFAFRDFERFTLRPPDDGPSSAAEERFEVNVLARASRSGGRLLVEGTTSASSTAGVTVAGAEVGASPTTGAGAGDGAGSAAGELSAAAGAVDPSVSPGGTDGVASVDSAWNESTMTGRGDNGTFGGANGTSSPASDGASAGLAR